MTEVGLKIDPTTIDRFRADLDPLLAAGERVGIAVSGGPDSMALLLLAAAARPGQVEAATIDHAMREGSREEAEMVASACQQLGVPHTILTVAWKEMPASAIQERARSERYRLLGFWAEERGLDAIATAHHADDQAETFLMRLARGAGVRGLAAMRRRSIAPGTETPLIRPLLDWRRSELEQLCRDAGVEFVADPSNQDHRFERVRVREALATSDWLNPEAIARSSAYLSEAEAGLDWAMRQEWHRGVHEHGGSISYRPEGAAREILRRVAARAVRRLSTEGDPNLRGAELDRLLATLNEGGTTTLRGVLCRGGSEWRFSRAPERRS